MNFHVGPIVYRLVVSNRAIFNEAGEELEAIAHEARRLLVLSLRVEPERREELVLHELCHAYSFHFPPPRDEEERCQLFAIAAKHFRIELEAQGGAEALTEMIAQYVPHLSKPKVERTAYRQHEAAKLLGVASQTLRDWARLGKIATARPNGGAVLIPVMEVERLLSSRKLELFAAKPARRTVKTIKPKVKP
jgi:excisionase family DNA binding protein